ncbi:hypothetical protein B5S28_g952 [[Candida] boidinii]|nr:hypothetical protein B5S28_g952 [[Candida] boidinii]OWB77566.1 hypothetical protein B5S32_g1736 [[Candida] boidinii]
MRRDKTRESMASISTSGTTTDDYQSAAESISAASENSSEEQGQSNTAEDDIEGVTNTSMYQPTTETSNSNNLQRVNTSNSMATIRDEEENAEHNVITRTRTDTELYTKELDEEIHRQSEALSKIASHFSTKSKKSNAEAEEDERRQSSSTIENEFEKVAIGDEEKIPGSEQEGGEEFEGYDPRETDWDGPEDPDNPINWPTWRKWFTTMSVAFICLVVTLGSSIFVCGVPQLMELWGISQTLGLAGLTFYVLGLAFGPVLGAPLSEIFGRKIVYCSTLPISMLFIMGVGLSKNIGSILVLRFFAGFSASACLAVGGGSITDIWRPHEIGLAMTLFCLAPLAGPVIGPIIGGFVAENKGWKWTMWVNLMFAGAILPFILVAPESYKPIIMRKRLKKRGLKIKKPDLSFGQFLVLILFITVLKPLQMLGTEPIVVIFSIYTAFIFAVLFGFFEAFPVIFRGVYGMNLGISGLTFLGVGVGLLMGAAVYVYIDKRIFFRKHEDGYIGQKDADGNPIPPTPESRLITCKIGAVFLGPSLFWLGWTAKYHTHWMAPIAAGVPFGFSLILIFFSILTYFAMSYPPLSVASALAANNLLRYVLASVFPLFTVQMYKNLNVGWASTVFGFIGVALAPVPWIFCYVGPRLRAKSKFGFGAMKEKEAEEEAPASNSSLTDENDVSV